MIFEFVALTAMAITSVAIAKAVGLSSRWLLLPAGFVLVVALRLVTYSAASLAGQPQLATLTFWLTLTVIAITCTALNIKRKLFDWRDYTIAVVSSATSVVQFWLLGAFPPKHGDSLYILAMAETLSRGLSPAGFSNSNAIKRGFAYPLMMATGQPGSYFGAFTFFCFITLVLLAGWLASQLLKNFEARNKAIVATLVSLAIFSSPMGIRLAVYINGHLLLGIAVLLAVSLAVRVRQRARISELEFWLLLACQLVITTSRPEGILIALVTVLPVLHLASRKHASILIFVPFLALADWLVIFDSYLLDAIPGRSLTLLLVGAIVAVLLSLGWFTKIRKHATWTAIWVLTALLLTVTLLATAQMLEGYLALFTNLFAFTGDWGTTFLVLAAVLIPSSRAITKSQELKDIATLALLFVVASVASKLADAGQANTISIGHATWQDSLNRMWIQYLLVFAVLAVVAVVSRLEPEKRVAELQL